MAEITLKKMAQEQGLDYTCIRLAIVYGAHDHKIQGFHRMLFSIADESMPVLFTKKNTLHSYSNSRKLPYFIDYILGKRHEFSGQTYHFVRITSYNVCYTKLLRVQIRLYLQNQCCQIHSIRINEVIGLTRITSYNVCYTKLLRNHQR